MEAIVLDACCGSRMMWHDRQDGRALFCDKRNESHTLCDGRILTVSPDLQMDFCAMPFEDNTFNHVVFDPPHLKHAGNKSWLAKKYGRLGQDWREDIKAGFAECFRVLKPHGTLIFKWNEEQVKAKDVLKLTDQKPLYGHFTGRSGKTIWMAFIKD